MIWEDAHVLTVGGVIYRMEYRFSWLKTVSKTYKIRGQRYLGIVWYSSSKPQVRKY